MTEQIILKNIVKQRDRIIKGGLKAAKSDLREVVNSKSMSATNNDVIKTLGNVSEELLSKRKKVISQAEQIKALKEQVQSLKGRYDNESKEEVMSDKVSKQELFQEIKAALMTSEYCQDEGVQHKPFVDQIKALAQHSNEYTAVILELMGFEPGWVWDGESAQRAKRLKDSYIQLKADLKNIREEHGSVEVLLKEEGPDWAMNMTASDGVKKILKRLNDLESNIKRVKESLKACRPVETQERHVVSLARHVEIEYKALEEELLNQQEAHLRYKNAQATQGASIEDLEASLMETQKELEQALKGPSGQWEMLCAGLDLDPNKKDLYVRIKHAYTVTMYLCERMNCDWYCHPNNLKSLIDKLAKSHKDSRTCDALERECTKLEERVEYLTTIMSNAAAHVAQALLTPENIANIVHSWAKGEEQ
jgi:hypothetical protein